MTTGASPVQRDTDQAPRGAIAVALLGGALQIAFLATQLSTASGTLLITYALGPPAIALGAYWLWTNLRSEPHSMTLLAAVQIRLGGATGLVIAGLGLLYIVGTGWLMSHVAYDVWGAFVAAPLIAWLATRVIRKLFADDLEYLRRAAQLGLMIKAVGTLARYWIANEVYGGAADATNYHYVGKRLAGRLYTGKLSVWEMIPHSQGTKFIEELTGFLYSMVGSSRLAGFLWFGMLGYFGVLLVVRATVRSIPGMLSTRYMWLCVLMPSLVYWPSSVGKEAWISLALGMVTLGASRIWLGRVRAGLPWVAAGVTGTAMVRPHMAMMFSAGLVLALTVALGARRWRGAGRPQRRLTSALLLLLGIGALTLVGRITLQFLDTEEETNKPVSKSIVDVINEAGQRTTAGGSSFQPVEIAGPIDYPEAVLRTLTRPLLYEANSFATLLPAVEMTFLVGLIMVNWRRLLRLPWLMVTSPFVMYGVSICIMFGLVWSSFGNLAILVRQRSLVMPFLLLLPCLPLSGAKRRNDESPITDERQLWLSSRPH